MRGCTCHSFQYHLKHRFSMFENLIVPEAQHAITQCFESLRSPCIQLNLFRVLPTIQLDYQLRIGTYKVDDVTIYFMLPAKLPTAKLSAAQVTPQQLLCIRHVPAQSPRTIHIQTFHP